MVSREAWIAVGVVGGLGCVVFAAFMAGMGAAKRTAVEMPKPSAGYATESPKPPERIEETAPGFDESWEKMVRQMESPGVKKIASLSGNGNGQSADFVVSGNSQFVVWGLDPSAKTRMLIIEPRSGSDSGDLITPDATNDWTGNSAAHLSPGKYYLNVISTGKWKINVYER